MATQAEVDLYNLAMGEIGHSGIESFDDGTPAAEAAELRYRHTIGFLLGLRQWTFQRKVVQLSRLEAAPQSGYEYQYEIPGASRVLSVFKDLSSAHRPLREGWRFYEGRIHSHYETLWAEVPVVSDPTSWPQVFQRLAVIAIAEAGCMQHTANRALKADLRMQAYGSESDYPYGGLVAAAIAQDSQQDPGDHDQMIVGPGPLIEARY